MTDWAELLYTAPRSTPAEPRLGAVRRTVREVGLAMIVAGVIVLLFVAYQLWGTSLAERHDQKVLARSFQQALTHNSKVLPTGKDVVATAPGARNLSPSTPTGQAIGHLVIPSIHLDKFVVQGTAEADLMKGPGHYVDTPMPGQKGNVGIAGHRTTYGAPFFDLGRLKPGAWIYITNAAGHTFDYRVAHKEVVSPTDVGVLHQTRDAQLTLTTCNPPYSAVNRLVVVARMVGRPAPATVRVTTTPLAPVRSVNLGHGNSAGWPPAIAFGAAVVVLWVLTRLAVARTRRWRRAGALATGIVVCAVPLWFCFENVVRLLPTNI
ncbi:MAG TPA: sortase [Acidimicrobiales bacterium]|nr:sortase [Acidimicrobiales bacterium]